MWLLKRSQMAKLLSPRIFDGRIRRLRENSIKELLLLRRNVPRSKVESLISHATKELPTYIDDTRK